MSMPSKRSFPQALGAAVVALALTGMLSGCGILVAGAAGAGAGYVAGTAASDDDDSKSE